MNWILEHLQIVVVIATTVAWWLNQRREAKKTEDGESPGTTRPVAGRPKDNSPWAPVDYEEIERTRKIQDEIRRKIAERRGEAGPPPVPPAQSRPVAPPAAPPRPEPVVARPAERRADRQPWAADDEAAAAQVNRWDERIQELQRTRAQAERRAAEIRAAQPAVTPVPLPAAAAAVDFVEDGSAEDWLATLRDPHEVRRAIILREVLGEPVGMRR